MICFQQKSECFWLVQVKIYEPPSSKQPPNGSILKPVPARTKAVVLEKGEEELKRLQDGGPDAAVDIKLMALAAETMALLCGEPHDKVLVAQGGILAATQALKWDIHSDINTPCAAIVHRLAALRPDYLQMVRCKHHLHVWLRSVSDWLFLVD
jgi:hypothetical protein